MLNEISLAVVILSTEKGTKVWTESQFLKKNEYGFQAEGQIVQNIFFNIFLSITVTI